MNGHYKNNEEGKELDAIVEAIKAGKILQKHNASNTKVIDALQKILVEGRESNRLVGHNDGVWSVSFSPDGKTLATGSEDKTIKLWNVETGQEIRTLSGHNDDVLSVSFSPDGKTLATSSEDKTIKLWNGEYGWGLDGLMGRSCDWVRVYLHNPNSGVKEEDRYLCDGIGGKSSKL